MWLGAEIQDAEVETCGPFAGHREHTKSLKSSHHPFQIITIPALRLSAEYLCPFQFQPYNQSIIALILNSWMHLREATVLVGRAGTVASSPNYRQSPRLI